MQEELRGRQAVDGSGSEINEEKSKQNTSHHPPPQIHPLRFIVAGVGER
jgi:hypothetical protein